MRSFIRYCLHHAKRRHAVNNNSLCDARKLQKRSFSLYNPDFRAEIARFFSRINFHLSVFLHSWYAADDALFRFRVLPGRRHIILLSPDSHGIFGLYWLCRNYTAPGRAGRGYRRYPARSRAAEAGPPPLPQLQP